jgi:hypothetical protein
VTPLKTPRQAPVLWRIGDRNRIKSNGPDEAKSLHFV